MEVLQYSVVNRETREGSPLLTFESDVNGDSKSTSEKGLPWWVGWAYRGEFCSAFADLVDPGQNIFFPHRTLGRQPCWVACLLVSVSGRKGTVDLFRLHPSTASECRCVRKSDYFLVRINRQVL